MNDICSMDRHFQFADKVVRLLSLDGHLLSLDGAEASIWHLLSLDGAEIAAVMTCGTDNCPSCECQCYIECYLTYVDAI